MYTVNSVIEESHEFTFYVFESGFYFYILRYEIANTGNQNNFFMTWLST